MRPAVSLHNVPAKRVILSAMNGLAGIDGKNSVRQRRRGSRGGTRWRYGRWRARPDWTCLLASLAGNSCRAALLVALHGAYHALAVRRNSAVLHVARPGIDHLSRGIDVLGV